MSAVYLRRNSCITCGEHISKIAHNLKTTRTTKSKVLMIKLVEEVYNNISLLHCNICLSCYNLLNELDIVQERQKELYSQLLKNISKLNKSKKSKNDVAFDSSVCAAKDEPIEIPDIDLKKLPIKVTRIPSNCITKTAPTLPQPPPPPEVSSDQDKVFEEIQTSIQIDLSRHVEEHLNKCKPVRNILCEICGQSFKSKPGYDSHIKKHDNIQDEEKLLSLNKLDNYFCEICGKLFSKRGALEKHVQIHTGETRFQCEHCGKKFFHQSSFYVHQKIHTGERNFKCETCSHLFLTNSHLKRHIKVTHSGEKRQCNYCDKTFSKNCYLKTHIKRNHKELEELEKVSLEQRIEYYEVPGTFITNGFQLGDCNNL